VSDHGKTAGLWVSIIGILWAVSRCMREGDGAGTLACAAAGLALASPILLFWWWSASAERRREQATARDLARAAMPPSMTVRHTIVVELPEEDAARLASEMECGTALAHRAAGALAASLPRVTRFEHAAVQLTADEDWRDLAGESRQRTDALAAYRDAPGSSTATTDVAAPREVVWHLVVACALEPPAAPTLVQGGLDAWLDAIVPVTPAHTLASEVILRHVPARTPTERSPMPSR